MKLTKFLSLVLIAMMVVGIVGCSGTGTPTASPAASASAAAPSASAAASVAPSATPAASTAAEAPASNLAEHMDLDIAFWDLSNTDDPRIKLIEEKFNVTFKVRNISWDTGTEQITIYAATNDMPDSTATYSTSTGGARIYNWIDQGIIRDVPADMMAKYSNLQALADKHVALHTLADLKGGKFWFSPRLDSQNNIHEVVQSMIYYRKDWMANVGITKIPETIDECYELWKAYTLNDPDGNGKQDTFGITFPKGTTLFSAFGVDTGEWIKEDGKWIPAYASSTCIEPLKFMRKLYQEGVIDPEYQNKGWSQAVESITQDIAGSLLRNGDISWLNGHIYTYWGESHPDQDYKAVWDVLPPPKKDANTPPMWPLKLDVGANEIAMKTDDAHLDRLLMIFDYLLSDEGLALKRYGIEGETYTRDANGKVTFILNADGKPVLSAEGNPYTSGPFFSLCEWGFDYIADKENYVTATPEEAERIRYFQDMGERTRAMYNAAINDENVIPKMLSTPAKDILALDAGNKIMGIIVGTDDVETAFNTMVADFYAQGLTAAVDEVTAEMAKLGQ